MARRYLFLVGSTRRGGNTEHLARIAAHALPEDAEQHWLHLLDYPLPPFTDTRHSSGYAMPEGNARMLADATLAATDLVFVAPTYWYGLPWPLKHYLDHWSHWMRIPELQFKQTLAGRTLHAVIVDSDEDPADGSSLPVIDSLRRTAEYMAMQWHGVLLGHANRPGEIANDAAAISAAGVYFTS